MSLLSLGKLCIPLFHDLLKFGEFLGLLLEIVAKGELRFLGFFGGDAGALRCEPLGDLLVNRFLCFLKSCLALLKRLLALRHVGVLLHEALLVVAAHRFQERRSEGFSESDLSSALRTNNSRFRHGVLLKRLGA